MAEQLCGNRLAHDACRFKGEVIERPFTIGCKAPERMYSACPYADHWGVTTEIRRRQQVPQEAPRD